jgi:hypothetical protein
VKLRLWAISGLVAVLAVLIGAQPASATSAQTNLRLVGGDTLQANAWHCGTYWNTCSWANSAKLLGYNPAYARSITNESELQVHGVSVSISLGSSWNVSVVYHSTTLIRSRWTNYNAWISDSSGSVKVSPWSTYVSSKETASAYHPIFGSPHGLVAYAGACC